MTDQINMWGGRVIVPPYGSNEATIVVVGEAPGAEEEKAGKPFVGKAGKNLTQLFATIGIDRENLYMTNAVKVRPTTISPKTGKPINRPPNKEELTHFTPLLQSEIESIAPQLVVTLGNVALQCVTGMEKNTVGLVHGTLLEGRFPVFALYHPASIIYNQSLKEVYAKDLVALKTLLEDLGFRTIG